MITRIREPFNALSHFAGAALALPGLYLLLNRSSEAGAPYHSAALVVYGACLFGLFFASGLYHTVIASPRTTENLRKVDHSAIYLLIAGTYTPVCVIAFTGFWQRGFLAIIWALALAGITVKIFVIHAPRWFTAGVYIVMGWLSLLAVREILLQLTPGAVAWLVAGGLLYTLGAVIYITRKGDFYPGVFGFHEVWHIFVLLGAAAHFAAVANIL